MLAAGLAVVTLAAFPAGSHAPAIAPAPPAGGTERAVALTFDDLPLTSEACEPAIAREVTERILEALAEAQATAVGFVNASRTC